MQKGITSSGLNVENRKITLKFEQIYDGSKEPNHMSAEKRMTQKMNFIKNLAKILGKLRPAGEAHLLVDRITPQTVGLGLRSRYSLLPGSRDVPLHWPDSTIDRPESRSAYLDIICRLVRAMSYWKTDCMRAEEAYGWLYSSVLLVLGDLAARECVPEELGRISA
ncbi:hypothetical protein BofuT4_P153900.1 [Botrytis cinerea T4]|uniref:Uncharacterized protein n=1 Tax=Botryotinia fuckeliana (strain T4) TaxID=999810 RepID=G2YW30_BOTF4|nr:hypothetical protein BofuT4_P153900.1 [Botrytis cinerea T4]